MRKRGFLFRLAFLNTFKRKYRASLAVGGIALSSAVMVVLFGVSDGLKNLVTQEVSNTDTANVVTVNQRNAQQVLLNQEKISAIKSISGVGDIQQRVGMVGDVRYHGVTVNLPLYAVTNDFFRTNPVQRVSGEVTGQLEGSKAILSTKALEVLGASPQQIVSRQVSIKTEIPKEYAAADVADKDRVVPATDFAVVGTVDQGVAPVAYIPLEYVTQHGLKSVSQLKVTVTYPEKMPAVREAIEQMGYQTTSIQDSIDQVNRIFGIIQRVIFLFGIIALVITVFGTFNVITLTLIEETKQIGFLRLMGMQRSSVGFLFTAQAIMLTSVGAVCGVVIGVLTGYALNGLVRSLVGDTVFTGQVYIFTLPAIQISIILMLSLVVGWVVGLMPAKKAVMTGPLEELRT